MGSHIAELHGASLGWANGAHSHEPDPALTQTQSEGIDKSEEER